MPRVIRGNGRQETITVYGPDAWSYQAASLGIATNPYGAMSAGVHTSGTPRGFSGDRGSGVNRWGGATLFPLQQFSSAVVPIAAPLPQSSYLGFGAGVSGQPGLPSTGQDATGLASMIALGHYGMTG